MDEDIKLVKKTLKGQKKAFEMIIRKYQRPLINYIGRMVGERELALDFSQEVFIKAYSSLHTFQPQYKFSTWLYKIASNYIIDYWRKKKVQHLSLDHYQEAENECLPLQIPDDEPSIVKKFELSQIREKIEKTLSMIPTQLRELFVWRHVNGLSYEEIAEIKGLPVGTVKNRVFQAKEMIRQSLEEKP